MAKVKLGNVKGPKGDQGGTGATGPQGPQGPTGPTGPKGATGARGSQWYTGTAVTGTSTTPAVFPGTGIAAALVGDIYLNTSTGNVYHCTTAGAAAVAKWAYVGCIRGLQGPQGPKGATGATGATGPQGNVGATGPQGPKGDKGDPTTVDAVLSATSTNPVQNKVINQKFADVQDSLAQLVMKKTIEVTTSNNGNTRVDLSSDKYALLSVLCRDGIGNASGVVCIPYVYSVRYKELGFHAISESSPFGVIANKTITVDIYYISL